MAFCESSCTGIWTDLLLIKSASLIGLLEDLPLVLFPVFVAVVGADAILNPQRT
mgnify:CR=1 FL=1